MTRKQKQAGTAATILLAAGLTLTACSTGTQVNTLPQQTAEQADATMKATAIAALSQIHGWVVIHNKVVNTKDNTPIPIPGANEKDENTTFNPDLYRVLPENTVEANTFLTVLDSDTTITDYMLTPNVTSPINPDIATMCVSVSKTTDSIQGTQKAWTMYKKGNKSAMLLENVTTCKDAAVKANETTMNTVATISKNFPTFVKEIPAASLTPLGESAQTYGEATLLALSEGIPPSTITSETWTPEQTQETEPTPDSSETPSETNQENLPTEQPQQTP